ncbi:SWIM zinc finger domain-containing protein [Thermococcus sp. 2319x1]|uniref:SWIM zinc finger family protein n=1 Tax=Thermococcus sp. 2319x1 TaxID=1674923 RepID=UPI001583F3B5|nr:SWIM zinc finger family protein [Thermococcus sp. 2319x1]
MRVEELRRVFGSRVFERGERYYREGRVIGVVKIGDKLYAKVKGSKTYAVEFDLKKNVSYCTCPYGMNCKHGVSAFFAYSNGEFFDGDAFLRSLEDRSKSEILETLREILEDNPDILLGITEDVSSYFKGHISYESALRINRILKRKKIPKEKAWELVKYICKHYYDFEGFYDDYRDLYYGDLVLEPLFELIERGLSKEDFDHFVEILELSEIPEDVYKYAYGVLLRNAWRFREEILNASDVSVKLKAPLLAKIGEKKKAEEMILNSDLSLKEKVALLLEVNPELARELGLKLSDYSLLIEYFGKKRNYEEVLEIYAESDGLGYLVSYVCDAIKATGKLDMFEEILKKESKSIAFLCALELNLGDRLAELFPSALEEYMKGMLSRSAVLDSLSIIQDLRPLIPSVERIIEFEVAKKNRGAYEFAAKLLNLVKKVDREEYERLVKKLKEKYPKVRVLWEVLEHPS